MNTPQLLGIQIAEDKGAPMLALKKAKVVEGGIEGDRYTLRKGSFSKTRVDNRHISLIESETIQDVRKENIDVTFADTRRNLLTIGIRLNDLVGEKFFIGDVLVEGVELCDPCARPGILSGKDDVKKRFKDAFENRGGLRVRVLETGEIHEGDLIQIENVNES